MSSEKKRMGVWFGSEALLSVAEGGTGVMALCTGLELRY